MKKKTKDTRSGLTDADGQCRLPVYVGRRGAAKGNRNAEREGFHNREAKALHARYSAVLQNARATMKEAERFLRELRVEQELNRPSR